MKNELKRDSNFLPEWTDGDGKIFEAVFAEEYIKKRPMKCIHGRLFTVDGMIEDEGALKNEIYGCIKDYVQTNLAKRVSSILQSIKIAAYSEPLPAQSDRIHVSNGTLFTDGSFTEEKEFCMNRLPVIYSTEAKEPVVWLKFLSQLLHDEDILTLQEYFGYLLLPVTKAQKMLLMVGKGGEGKSRVGLVLRTIFGPNMYTGSIQKIETSKFARADLEYMLAMVDDDMKMEALPQTNHIKSIVTLEDKIDIERKGQQSVQGELYVRFICFGNGVLHALYDKSDGFYRRQLLLTTKDKPEDREDDPFLIDKLKQERDGIFLWAFEGLQRLLKNHYQFTVSSQAKQNLEDAKEEGNNILAFMKSTGYIRFEKGKSMKSTDLYSAYESWCDANLEKPRASSSFLHYIRENQKKYGIIYDEKCINNHRGFHHICREEWKTITGPTPFD